MARRSTMASSGRDVSSSGAHLCSSALSAGAASGTTPRRFADESPCTFASIARARSSSRSSGSGPQPSTVSRHRQLGAYSQLTDSRKRCSSETTSCLLRLEKKEGVSWPQTSCLSPHSQQRCSVKAHWPIKLLETHRGFGAAKPITLIWLMELFALLGKSPGPHGIHPAKLRPTAPSHLW